MPSGTLMEYCKILDFVMSQNSLKVKLAKCKTVFTRLVRPRFIFKKSIHLLFVPDKYHYGVFNVWVYVVIHVGYRHLYALLPKIALGGGG